MLGGALGYEIFAFERGFESSGRGFSSSDFTPRLFNFNPAVQLNAIQLSQLGLFREFTTSKRDINPFHWIYIYIYIHFYEN